MIVRKNYLNEVKKGLKQSPVVALLGPRQCGKTTLARQLVQADSPNYFDLEDPTVAALMEQAMTTLRPLKGLVVIDEAQRQESIFPVLRVLADREDRPARFLILGTASPELSRQASESLADRVCIIEMRGFSFSEVSADNHERLWLRGGFPRAFLARSEAESVRWRNNFIRTFLERDLAQLGFGISPMAIGRFWRMLSHYHGQIWNGNELANSLGIAPNTARNYLDALEQTYMVRRLMPWHANLGKRLVKTPKIYFRDSGIFHTLQGIERQATLQTHPKLGASWEGFALEEILHALKPSEAYFYAVHSGSELDLFLPMAEKRLGIDFKRQDAPQSTRSMHIAIEDLKLDELWIIYPGSREYRLDERIVVIPLTQLISGN